MMFDGYNRVAALLDDLAAAGSSAVPRGARGTLSRAIDEMRTAGALKEHVAIAESASLHLHRLEACLASKDAAGLLECREQLSELRVQWAARQTDAVLETPARPFRITAITTRLTGGSPAAAGSAARLSIALS